MLLEQSKYKGTGTTTSFSFVMQHFNIIICDQIPCLPYSITHVCMHVCVCGLTCTIMLYVNIIMISELKETALKMEQHRSPNVSNAIYMCTVPLPVVLYGCETWSLTLREECTLRVLKNRVLRRVFGPKRDERTGEWRKLHNEELSDLYSSPNIVRVVKSRRMRWAGHVAHMGEGRGVHRVLVGKPEGKRPLGRPRHRWEDNIQMDVEEVGGGCGDWMELAQDRDRWRALVGTVRNLRVPKMRGIS